MYVPVCGRGALPPLFAGFLYQGLGKIGREFD
jgi:hypothetical protein